MIELRTLQDAFEELERRADAAPVSSPQYDAARRGHHRPATRVLAPVAAAAAVVLAVAGVATWRGLEPASHNGQSAGGPSSAPSCMPSPSPDQAISREEFDQFIRDHLNCYEGARPSSPPVTQSNSPSGTGVPPTPSPRSSTPGSDRFQPPTTEAQLAAQARAILAGTATITVTETSAGAAEVPAMADTGNASDVPATPVPGASVSVSPDAGSGTYIKGALTADGLTGGYDLNVYLAAPDSKAMCDGGTACSIKTLGDGSSLAVGSWHDPAVPGGITYQVELVRPDGADILMHLSTEQDPKGESTVTASQLPLTTDQMITFVTSDRW